VVFEAVLGPYLVRAIARVDVVLAVASLHIVVAVAPVDAVVSVVAVEGVVRVAVEGVVAPPTVYAIAPPSALITLALELPSRVSGPWVPKQFVGQVLITASVTPLEISKVTAIAASNSTTLLIRTLLARRGTQRSSRRVT